MNELFFRVVGVTFEGRQSIIEMMTGCEVVSLQSEPWNEFDPYALAVLVDFPPEAGVSGQHKIGYVPRDYLDQVAFMRDASRFEVSINQIVGGFVKGDGSRASLGVWLRLYVP